MVQVPSAWILVAALVVGGGGAACVDDPEGGGEDAQIDALRVGPLGLDGWSRYLAPPRWGALEAAALAGGTWSPEAAAAGFFASRLRRDHGFEALLAPAGHEFTFIDILLEAWDDKELVAFQLDARRFTGEDAATIRVRFELARDDAPREIIDLVELVRVGHAWFVFRPPS